MQESDEERQARERRAEERRQRNWMIKKIDLHDDHEAFDIEFWQAQSVEDRYREARHLSDLVAVSQGYDPASRLQRSVEYLQRPPG